VTEPRPIAMKLTRTEYELLKTKLAADRALGHEVDPVLEHVAKAAELGLANERALEAELERDTPTVEGPERGRGRGLGGAGLG
jgi:hypothetical protein